MPLQSDVNQALSALEPLSPLVKWFVYTLLLSGRLPTVSAEEGDAKIRSIVVLGELLKEEKTCCARPRFFKSNTASETTELLSMEGGKARATFSQNLEAVLTQKLAAVTEKLADEKQIEASLKAPISESLKKFIQRVLAEEWKAQQQAMQLHKSEVLRGFVSLLAAVFGSTTFSILAYTTTLEKHPGDSFSAGSWAVFTGLISGLLHYHLNRNGYNRLRAKSLIFQEKTSYLSLSRGRNHLILLGAIVAKASFDVMTLDKLKENSFWVKLGLLPFYMGAAGLSYKAVIAEMIAPQQLPFAKYREKSHAKRQLFTERLTGLLQELPDLEDNDLLRLVNAFLDEENPLAAFTTTMALGRRESTNAQLQSEGACAQPKVALMGAMAGMMWVANAFGHYPDLGIAASTPELINQGLELIAQELPAWLYTATQAILASAPYIVGVCLGVWAAMKVLENCLSPDIRNCSMSTWGLRGTSAVALALAITYAWQQNLEGVATLGLIGSMQLLNSFF